MMKSTKNGDMKRYAYLASSLDCLISKTFIQVLPHQYGSTHNSMRLPGKLTLDFAYYALEACFRCLSTHVNTLESPYESCGDSLIIRSHVCTLDVLGNLGIRNRDELVLVTREYLLPYLRFIRDNKKVYRAAFRNPGSMGANARYRELKQRILGPILERFEIPAARRPYYIAYYIEGIAAIVKEWLRQDCADEVEMIADIIESSVRPRDGSHEK